jgi:hypothetical protein
LEEGDHASGMARRRTTEDLDESESKRQGDCALYQLQEKGEKNKGTQNGKRRNKEMPVRRVGAGVDEMR